LLVLVYELLELVTSVLLLLFDEGVLVILNNDLAIVMCFCLSSFHLYFPLYEV
jgi:hypothetical protein